MTVPNPEDPMVCEVLLMLRANLHGNNLDSALRFMALMLECREGSFLLSFHSFLLQRLYSNNINALA